MKILDLWSYVIDFFRSTEKTEIKKTVLTSIELDQGYECTYSSALQPKVVLDYKQLYIVRDNEDSGVRYYLEGSIRYHMQMEVFQEKELIIDIDLNQNNTMSLSDHGECYIRERLLSVDDESIDDLDIRAHVARNEAVVISESGLIKKEKKNKKDFYKEMNDTNQKRVIYVPYIVTLRYSFNK